MGTDETVDVGSRVERLEEIAETLEAGEVDLERAKELRDEADGHLTTLRDALAAGDGEIVEIDGDDVDGIDPDGDA